MLFRNLKPKNSHVNASRCIVESMKNKCFSTNCISKQQREAFYPLSVSFEPVVEDFPTTDFKTTKFPVRVRFAIATNKALGQSLDGAVVGNQIFPVIIPSIQGE